MAVPLHLFYIMPGQRLTLRILWNKATVEHRLVVRLMETGKDLTTEGSYLAGKPLRESSYEYVHLQNSFPEMISISVQALTQVPLKPPWIDLLIAGVY